MKKILSTTAFALLITGSIIAQSFLTLNPNPASVTGDASMTQAAHATLSNNGPDDKDDIYWRRITNDLTEGWTTAVCDFELCYSSATSLAPTNITLASEESGEVKVNFYPEGIGGEGYVELIYYSISDSASYNTLGVFTADLLSTGFSSPSLDNSFDVYPNPAINTIHAVASYSADIKKLEIVNIVGRSVYTTNWSGGSGKLTLDITSLPEGIYFVRFINADNQVVNTQKVSVAR
jgi:hypothetical protein